MSPTGERTSDPASGHRATFVLVGVILLTVAVAVAAFVLLIPCSFCYGKGIVLTQHDRDRGELAADPCSKCAGRARLPLLKALGLTLRPE